MEQIFQHVLEVEPRQDAYRDISGTITGSNRYASMDGEGRECQEHILESRVRTTMEQIFQHILERRLRKCMEYIF